MPIPRDHTIVNVLQACGAKNSGFRVRKMRNSDLLKKFVGSGYFPKELPPPFSSKSMADKLAIIEAAWTGDGRSAPTTRADVFTIPRHGKLRRRLSTPNPVSHFYLAKAISEGWNTISQHIDKSPISLFRTTPAPTSTRVFEPIDFDIIEAKKNAILSRCDTALMTDISRYYPTIYTHSIPWGLHGKAICKRNINNKTAKSWLGNVIDDLVRRGQDGQSLGIPLGPDTSIVISEIIGSSIDRSIQTALDLDEDVAFRYTDDFVIGMRDARTVDRTLAEIATALAHYELELSYDKTRILHAGTRADPDWALEISQFRLPVDEKRKKKALEYYFKRGFQLAQANPSQNVLSYIIARSRSFSIDTGNWPVYEEFVLQCSRANATTLETVTRILIDGHRATMPMSRKWVATFISDLLIRHAALDHHWELCWLLFLARELRIAIPDRVVLECQKIESSAVGLLLLDLGSRGLANVGALKHRLANGMSAKDLRTGEWLVLYEGARLGWLGQAALQVIRGDMYFGTLLKAQVKFYIENKTVPRLVKERPSSVGDLFDTSYFRF